MRNVRFHDGMRPLFSGQMSHDKAPFVTPLNAKPMPPKMKLSILGLSTWSLAEFGRSSARPARRVPLLLLTFRGDIRRRDWRDLDRRLRHALLGQDLIHSGEQIAGKIRMGELEGHAFFIDHPHDGGFVSRFFDKDASDLAPTEAVRWAADQDAMAFRPFLTFDRGEFELGQADEYGFCGLFVWGLKRASDAGLVGLLLDRLCAGACRQEQDQGERQAACRRVNVDHPCPLSDKDQPNSMA